MVSVAPDRQSRDQIFKLAKPGGGKGGQTAPWMLQQRLWSGCMGENEKFSVGRS